MIIKKFTFNPVQVNTYVLHDETREAVVIDAGCYYDEEKYRLKKYIDENGLKIKRVLNTHLHFDHQFGNAYLFENYGVKPEAHAADEFLLEGVKAKAMVFGFPIREDAQELGGYLYPDEEIHFGTTTLKTIHVPGHSPGHLAYWNAKEKVLISGDALFQGSIGRTDLERGDYDTLINSITRKLLVLPDDTEVYPGHGPSTTIGQEKLNNPYL